MVLAFIFMIVGFLFAIMICLALDIFDDDPMVAGLLILLITFVGFWVGGMATVSECKDAAMIPTVQQYQLEGISSVNPDTFVSEIPSADGSKTYVYTVGGEQKSVSDKNADVVYGFDGNSYVEVVTQVSERADLGCGAPKDSYTFHMSESNVLIP